MSLYHKISVEQTELIDSASQADLTKLLYRLREKFMRANKNIVFNEECMKKKIFPKYIHINTKNPSGNAQKAVTNAKKLWLRDEIRKWYNIRDKLSHYLYLVHKNLAAKLHPVEFDILYYDVRMSIKTLGEKKDVIHKKKLHSLVQGRKTLKQRDQQPPSHSTDNNTGTRDNKIFANRVTNLSHLVLREKEINLLDKGLKHSPHINLKNKDLENLAICTELAINKIDDKIESDYLRLKTLKSLHDHKNKTQNSNMNQFLTLQRTLKDNNIIAIKADKGNSTVLLHRDTYNEKVETFLKDNGFIKLSSDPTQKYTIKTRKTLDNSKALLNTQTINSLKVMNTSAPKLTGYPKIHKPDAPIRPVVSSINSPTYRLAKHLNTIIREYLPLKLDHTIKNSHELINNIKNVHIPNNAKFVSFDIVNLFTNVPKNECIEIMRSLITKSHLDPFQKHELEELIYLTLDQNYAVFNKQVYSSPSGLAMGSALSPLLADIFMNHIEQIIFNSNNPLLKNICYWYRYVDDTLCLWMGTNRQLEQFLQFINTVHQNIKFTLEIEQNNFINFLDLTIGKDNHMHTFKIYRKPTYSDNIIHNESNTHYKHKMATFHSMIHRALHTPMSQSDYTQEINTIKTIALNNGYNTYTIDKIINNKKEQIAIKMGTKLERITENEYKWVSIPYMGKISETVASSLNKTNLKVSFSPYINLRKILGSPKDPTENKDKSGIYKLTCDSCHGVYLGQSGRKVGLRVSEHAHAYKNKKHTSSFATHLLETQHTFNKDNYTLLHNCDKGRKLDLLENLEIHRALQDTNITCFNEIKNLNKSVLVKPINNKYIKQ